MTAMLTAAQQHWHSAPTADALQHAWRRAACEAAVLVSSSKNLAGLDTAYHEGG